MPPWVRRLIAVGVIGLLMWQPVWFLSAFLAPGIAIVEAASALVDRFGPEPVGHRSGARHYVIPLTDMAIGSVPLAAIGFWVVTACVWLLARRERRQALRHGVGSSKR